MQILSGYYYSYYRAEDDTTSFSFFVGSYPIELSGKRFLCKGSLPVFPKYMPIELHGTWNGDIFMTDSFSMVHDAAMTDEFLKRSLKIPARTMSKVHKLYSDDALWNVSEDMREEMTDSGIKKEFADAIIMMMSGIRYTLLSWRQFHELGLNEEQIDKIRMDHYSVRDLKKRPYDIGFICGAPLSLCDRIAVRSDEESGEMLPVYHANHEDRISYIHKVIACHVMSCGDSYISLKDLEHLVRTRIWSDVFPGMDIDLTILRAMNSSAFVCVSEEGEVHLYPASCMETERFVAEDLRRRNEKPALPVSFHKGTLRGYDEEQKDAVMGCLEKDPITIITGGPGTGKTTVTRKIVEILEKNGQHVLLCAPTGRAAARIKEQTGHPAFTIHKLVGIRSIGSGYVTQFNRENPLECDAVIIDESSMIGIDMIRLLLSALPESCRIIFIGDVNQLPSVSPGNVLSDLIESSIFPVYRLLTIHRQADDSMIITNAYRILHDQSLEQAPDFVLETYTDTRKIRERICELYKSEYDTSDPYHLQILTPMKKGDLGTSSINDMILSLIPDRKEVKGSYAKGDKVMTIRNNYEPLFHYTNGDIGTIKEIDTEMVVIEAKRGPDIYLKDLSDLQHAYAATIHKSQGSEYDIVVVVLDRASDVMLYKDLIYTAITRAKKKVYVLTNMDPNKVITRMRAPRNTGLCKKLQNKTPFDKERGQFLEFADMGCDPSDSSH